MKILKRTAHFGEIELAANPLGTQVPALHHQHLAASGAEAECSEEDKAICGPDPEGEGQLCADASGVPT